jgi:alkylhydroperoxidase/carboxymuconolactone decarboxylase family protein YurZ
MENVDPNDPFAHFMNSMGNVAPSIRAMHKFAPGYFEGYVRMRQFIYASPPEGALDVKTVELIYVLLDIATNNLPGAENHLRAAMRAGLTTAELAQACMQVIHVFGIGTWGKTGHKVCELAESIEQNATRAAADANTAAS